MNLNEYQPRTLYRVVRIVEKGPWTSFTNQEGKPGHYITVKVDLMDGTVGRPHLVCLTAFDQQSAYVEMHAVGEKLLLREWIQARCITDSNGRQYWINEVRLFPVTDDMKEIPKNYKS